MFFSAALAGSALLIAGATAPPITQPHIVVHLNLAKGQQPENIALEPDGSADVTFGFNGQVARVGRTGRVQIIAQVPVPPDGNVPVVHKKIFTGGIVLAPDGTRYVAASTGTAGGTGIYRFRPGRLPIRIAALPAGAFLNGMAMSGGRLYIADSFESKVWSVPVRGGSATAWAIGDSLAPHGGFGANGLKVHHDAVWVSNTQQGTLIRIPITHGGRAGTPQVVDHGLGPIDDFIFHGRTVLAAINQDNKVILIRPNGTTVTALTAASGLSNPTALAISGHRIYITDAAYFTSKDPNLIAAHLTSP